MHLYQLYIYNYRIKQNTVKFGTKIASGLIDNPLWENLSASQDNYNPGDEKYEVL